MPLFQVFPVCGDTQRLFLRPHVTRQRFNEFSEGVWTIAKKLGLQKVSCFDLDVVFLWCYITICIRFET